MNIVKVLCVNKSSTKIDKWQINYNEDEQVYFVFISN